MRWPVLVAVVAAAAPAPLAAWTRPGHMVAAAIAYDELKRRDPAALALILKLAGEHPDRAPFEVAIGRAVGEDADRRRFLEMARWPDDARGGPYDHPTWHYRLKPVAEDGVKPGWENSGAGIEALALAVRVAGDPRAAPPERAVALSWILHIVPDLHQPLHAAERFARAWPEGDHAGSRVFVSDPETGKPISLHWLWDDSVNRDGSAEAASARATALAHEYPATGFEPLRAERSSARWLDESYRLAVTLAYRADAPRATTPEAARPAAPAYLAAVEKAAQQRLVLSSYRLADLLATVMKQ